MSFYQPAHEPSITKHNNQLFEFDSPNTIAKQASSQQPFVQAGGISTTGLSAPAPPTLPQVALKPTRQLNLRTRDWSNQPWKNATGFQGDTYSAPSFKSASSSSSFPVLLNSGSKTWGDRSISSTTSSPRTPSLLGVYDPKILAGQTTHLQHYDSPSSSHSSDSYSSSSYSSSSYSSDSPSPSSSSSGSPTHSTVQGGNPSSLPPLYPAGLPSTSGISSPSGLYSSGIPTTNYIPSSTIPLSHNYHLPSSSLAHSTTTTSPSLSKDTWNNQDTWNSNSSISPSSSSSSFSSIPAALPHPSLFGSQRKWKTGPYRTRPLRTRNWGSRGEEGWSQFNRGLYAHESALPFIANRQKWSEVPTEQQRSAPVQQQSAPIQQQPAPIQQQSFAPIHIQQQSFAPIPQQSFVQQSSIAPIAAPLAATPLAAPLLTGRKGKRAARKAAKQQAIQQKLTTELNPPVGDPAVNHYRRGAKATVPLAGPAIAGLAAPTGSLGSRRTGRRNNLGRRRGRLAAPALPVPATQPRTSASVTPVVGAVPYIPTSAPLSAASTAFRPTSFAPSFTRQVSSQGFVPLASTGFIQQQQPILQQQPMLYSSAEQQVRPLSSTFGQPIISSSNQPLYSANAPVVSQMLEKKFAQEPIVFARPTGSATL